MRFYLFIGEPIYEDGRTRSVWQEAKEVWQSRYGWRTVRDLLHTARLGRSPR